jgi:hypothetical protein
MIQIKSPSNNRLSPGSQRRPGSLMRQENIRLRFFGLLPFLIVPVSLYF